MILIIVGIFWVILILIKIFVYDILVWLVVYLFVYKGEFNLLEILFKVL